VATKIRVIKRLSSLGIVSICLSLIVASAALAAIPQVGNLKKTFNGQANEVTLRDDSERSKMYGADGTLITVLAEKENRESIDLSEIPQDIITAVLAIEDSDFYSHNGLNFKGTLRALIINANAGAAVQGGSTITQQLIKNAVLTSEKTAGRKATEAFLALRLEKELDKDEILEKYLNIVYFGSGAYGVEAAAETYWGYNNASELTMCDSSLLAGLIKSPIEFDPTRFQDAAKARRSVVLNRLLSLNKITKEDADICRESALPVQRKTPVATQPTNYFTEEVLQLLLKDETILGGESQSERFDMIYKGGLKIYTTMDPKAQAAAEEAQQKFAPQNSQGFTAALVSLDNESGAVRAVVGGPGFKIEQFNIATQGKKQPGSTMKPLVLAALFESGKALPNDTVRSDNPCSFKQSNGQIYTVGQRSGGGRQSIAAVTRASNNCAFVRLAQVVGNDTIIDVSRRLGISTIEDAAVENLSLPLGTSDLRPIEVAGAYSAFPNDGIYKKPWFIEKVENQRGDILYEHAPNESRALSKNTARMIAEILRTNVTREFRTGTGRRAQVVRDDGVKHVVAGKTGTTNDYVSAWFAGFTQYYTTVVWVGHPDVDITINRNAFNLEAYSGVYCCFQRGEGGLAAAPIFDWYMEIMHQDLEPKEFQKAENVLSRRKYLKVEGEPERVCNGIPPGKENVRPGLPVDADGDGTFDCLIPNLPPTTEPPATTRPPTTSTPITTTTIPITPVTPDPKPPAGPIITPQEPIVGFPRN